MIDGADLLLLSVVGLFLLLGIVRVHMTLRRDATRVQKYKLYAVRDRLISLVAAGKLKPTDFVFQEFYSASNNFIGAIDSINLKVVVSAFREMRNKGLDPTTKEKLSRIQAALQDIKDPEVSETVSCYYRTMLQILLENSWVLRVAVRYAWARELLKKLTPRAATSTEREAYWAYLRYQHAIHTL